MGPQPECVDSSTQRRRPVVVATSTLCQADNFASFIGIAAMSMPINLTVSQQFEIERFSRVIDATQDTTQLRSIAKQLLQAWHTQKAATHWVMAQQMGSSAIPSTPDRPIVDDVA